jgi:hypothetical protein
VTAVTHSSTELLCLAERVLHEGSTSLGACRRRAAAVLARQALEAALVELWTARGLTLTACSTRAQLACLRTYLGDDRLAAEIQHTWGALTSVCHHHPYELGPTATELRAWLDTAAAVLLRLHEICGNPQPGASSSPARNRGFAT